MKNKHGIEIRCANCDRQENGYCSGWIDVSDGIKRCDNRSLFVPSELAEVKAERDKLKAFVERLANTTDILNKDFIGFWVNGKFIYEARALLESEVQG